VDKAKEEEASRLSALPAKLLNNAAVLHMRGGEAAAALALMQEAVQVKDMPEPSSAVASLAHACATLSASMASSCSDSRQR
jgi:hypothetical protein